MDATKLIAAAWAVVTERDNLVASGRVPLSLSVAINVLEEELPANDDEAEAETITNQPQPVRHWHDMKAVEAFVGQIRHNLLAYTDGVIEGIEESRKLREESDAAKPLSDAQLAEAFREASGMLGVVKNKMAALHAHVRLHADGSGHVTIGAGRLASWGPGEWTEAVAKLRELSQPKPKPEPPTLAEDWKIVKACGGFPIVAEQDEAFDRVAATMTAGGFVSCALLIMYRTASRNSEAEQAAIAAIDEWIANLAQAKETNGP